MANVIAASVGASMSAATGRPNQGHLVYGVNQSQWYLFFLTSTNLLSLAYSSGFTSWTTSGTTLTLANAHASEGRDFAFGYANLASTDVVHMKSAYSGSNSYHTRFTLGATAWTVTNAEASVAVQQTIQPFSCSVALDSAARPFDAATDSAGNLGVVKYTNVDSGSAWTAGGTATSTVGGGVSNDVTSSALASLGATNMLVVADNTLASTGNFTQLTSSKYTGTWSTFISLLAATVTATSTNNWGMAALSTADIHVVAISNNSNTFVHRRYNGTAWANGNTPNTLTLAANSGIALVSDGTSVWAFAIDSSKNIQYSKWVSGTGWGAWTVLEATRTNTSSYITATYSAAANAIGVAWTEANGATFDIVGSILSLAVAPTVTFPWSTDLGMRLPRWTPTVMMPY